MNELYIMCIQFARLPKKYFFEICMRTFFFSFLIIIYFFLLNIILEIYYNSFNYC